MPIDHIGVPVPFSLVDAEASFLTAAFAHMGIRELMRPRSGVVGLGDEQGPWLWVRGVDYSGGYEPIPDGSVVRVHVALTAEDRAQVDAFHAAAVKAGGKDLGAPGLREYHPNYYGAFVISPAGHNVEAVVHSPVAEEG